MITTRDPTLLLEIEKSKLLMQSLAMLDAIMLPEWQYRYYSFDAHWSENVQVGSMRNGCGDDFCAWFSPAGCFIKGFAHESLMTPYANKEHRIWPGLLDDVPLKFLPHLEESAFRMQDITLALWRSKEDSTWRSGEIEFPLGGFVGDKDPDGFIMLLELMDGLPQDYQYFAKEYCEEEISLSDVDHIYQHKPLTESIVKSLNPELSLSDVMDDAATIGYPTSG